MLDYKTDVDLHDLKLRLELLEGDKKAHHEQSQRTIQTNKAELQKLRAQCKELRATLTKLNKSIPSTFALPMNEQQKLEQKVMEMHKKADDLHSKFRLKKRRVEEMEDKLHFLLQEAVFAAEADTSKHLKESKHNMSPARTCKKDIMKLENQLDKAVIKYNEAQSLRKIYDEILNQLQEESMTFDAQLERFDHALRAKKEEKEGLERMARDAYHARELVRTELMRIDAQINEDRKHRERDLQHRREQVRVKLESSEKLEAQLLAQTNNQQPTATAQNDVVLDSSFKEQATYYLESAGGNVDFDTLLKHMKELTGVEDLAQVVSKFEEQEATRQKLESLSRQHEERLNVLREQKQQQLLLLEKTTQATIDASKKEAKASSSQIQSLESKLNQLLCVLEDKMERKSRMLLMLSVIKSGILHLWDRLKEDKSAKPGSPSSVSDMDIQQILDTCRERVESILQIIQNKEIIIEGDVNTNATCHALKEKGLRPQLVLSTVASSPAAALGLNVRVKLDHDDSEEDEPGDAVPVSKGGKAPLTTENTTEEVVVPDRESMKKATMALINMRNAKQTRGRKKKRGKDDDDDDEQSD